MWAQAGLLEAGPGLPRGPGAGPVSQVLALEGGVGEPRADGVALASELPSGVVVGCFQEEAAHLSKEAFGSRLKLDPCIGWTTPTHAECQARS